MRGSAQAAGFALVGQELERPPQGYSADHPLIEDLKRKDFVLSRDVPDTVVTARDFSSRVVTWWRGAGEFMGFLTRAVGLPF